MRREGYEFQISKPTVVYKEIDGVKCEPVEYLIVDVPEDYMGVVMEKLGMRKSELINMASSAQGYMRLEFKIPARCLIGYRSELLTDTKGNGIMNHVFYGYESYKGDLTIRRRGSMIAWEEGKPLFTGFITPRKGVLYL